jgi:DNA polymerase III alpha subunit
MWTNINTEQQLIKGVLSYGPEILKNCIADAATLEKYLKILDTERLEYPKPVAEIDSTNWFIPQEYADMDIEEYLVSICPEENYTRLINELALYQKNNMIMVLKTMKYIVDTLRDNDIVWGVGRGSSVASYVLFLLGVHKIDSVKYNLPIDEFFKES